MISFFDNPSRRVKFGIIKKRKRYTKKGSFYVSFYL